MKDTGGPAFPGIQYKSPAGGGAHIMTIVGGMTLRDYFAARAMQGMSDSGCSNAAIAKCAYEMADEMLKAREA